MILFKSNKEIKYDVSKGLAVLAVGGLALVIILALKTKNEQLEKQVRIQTCQIVSLLNEKETMGNTIHQKDSEITKLKAELEKAKSKK